jgi:hypothetical protein
VDHEKLLHPAGMSRYVFLYSLVPLSGPIQNDIAILTPWKMKCLKQGTCTRPEYIGRIYFTKNMVAVPSLIIFGARDFQDLL